jgi:hypothetical protein
MGAHRLETGLSRSVGAIQAGSDDRENGAGVHHSQTCKKAGQRSGQRSLRNRFAASGAGLGKRLGGRSRHPLSRQLSHYIVLGCTAWSGCNFIWNACANQNHYI